MFRADRLRDVLSYREFIDETFKARVAAIKLEPLDLFVDSPRQMKMETLTGRDTINGAKLPRVGSDRA